MAGYPNPVSFRPPRSVLLTSPCKERGRAAGLPPTPSGFQTCTSCPCAASFPFCTRGVYGIPSAGPPRTPVFPKANPFCPVAQAAAAGGEGARSFDLQFPVSCARHGLSAGPAPGPAPRRCTQGTGLAARRSLPAGRGWMSLFHGPLLWTPITLLPPTSGAWGEGRWKRAGECRGLWGTLGMLPAGLPTWPFPSSGSYISWIRGAVPVCVQTTWWTLECLYINQRVLVGAYFDTYKQQVW